MKIAVIGAGAIGGLVAGYLKLKGLDVSLTGSSPSVKAIKEKGLKISGIRGDSNIKLEISEKLNYRPELAIISTKTQDIDRAIKENIEFIEDTTVLTTQNGIQADDIAARYIPKENIISSIVMFGATYLEPGKILHNFEGSWVIGRAFNRNDDKIIKISEPLNKIFPTILSEEIRQMKYLKLFVNANNCIPAVLGKSMQESFSDTNISRISIAIWKEGLDIVNKAGINPVSLPDFPLERVTKLTSLPQDEGAKIYSGIMLNLSREPLYGSVLQSIRRGKPSEIDYINGEFVLLAKKNKLKAPLNEKLVEMVHRVENTGMFLSKDEFIDATKSLLP